jgi:glycosyltransferase involved in cell wall biosynthesis
MKVLYITLENLSLHKGSVIHIKEVIGGLERRGHQVGLIGNASEEIKPADHFYNIYPKILFSFKYLRREGKSYLISSIFLFLTLFRILRQYDIIYARDFHTVIIALIPRLVFKKKLVFEINGLASEEQRLKSQTFFNQILAKAFQKAEKLAVRCSNRIVSVTPQIATYLIQHCHCRAEKVKVIGNGVNTEKFFPIDDDTLLSNWRKNWEIKREDVVIAFIGNLAPWQGVNILIESAFQLLTYEENVKFLIVGEGFLKYSIEKRVLDSGHEKKFIFTGMMNYEDIPALINMADICVAPFISRRNRTTGVSPIKVFEYMGCAKPVICSRIVGLEFVEVEGVGRLVEPEDVVGLEKELHNLIKDPQKRVRMGQKGLQIARERFSWEEKVIMIEDVLKSLAQ